MKKLNKNLAGFAHHALLGVVVIAVIALAGVKVLTGIHAANVPSVGSFAFAKELSYVEPKNSNQSAWIQLAVQISNTIKVKKVEFYSSNLNKSSLVAAVYQPTKNVNNDRANNYFVYFWDAYRARAGGYHWLAEIYPAHGSKYLAVNNKLKPYLDILNIGHGPVHGSYAGTACGGNYTAINVDDYYKTRQIDLYYLVKGKDFVKYHSSTQAHSVNNKNNTAVYCARYPSGNVNYDDGPYYVVVTNSGLTRLVPY